MSSDDDQQAPDPQDRREAVREKALQVHAQQSKARVIRRASVGIALVAVVAAAAVIVTWVVTSAASRPQLSPSNMTDDGVRVRAVGALEGTVDTGGGALASPTPAPSEASAPEPTGTSAVDPVDIRVYVDYLSADSGAFELANASQLAGWVQEGAATLSYHPVALLTAKSNGTKYSLRAAAAAACVATYAPDAFFAFNHALLERQPAADSDGFSDGELADLAIASGAGDPKVVRTCIEGEAFVSWVQDATERALSKPLPGTDDLTLTGPLVLVNGQPYLGALDDPKEFGQFVLMLSANAYYTNEPVAPTPTPTDSPTPAEPTPSKKPVSKK